MNAWIEEILLKRSFLNDKTKTIIVPITKPYLIPINNSFIRVYDSIFFYTFDGRSLLFSKDQEEPFASLPDENIDFFSVKREKNIFNFFLSLKRKFESATNSLNNRYCITRNVNKICKSNTRVLYFFKKDNYYFINEEILQDDKKWTGRNIVLNIEADYLDLFAT